MARRPKTYKKRRSDSHLYQGNKMIQTITNKKERKRIEAIASRLCTEQLAKTGAQIDILQIGQLTRVAQDALASGRTQDGTRAAIDEWIAHNRKNPIVNTATGEGITDEMRAKIKALPTLEDVTRPRVNAALATIGPVVTQEEAATVWADLKRGRDDEGGE